MKGGRRQCDGGLQLFSGIATPGQIKAGREKRGAIRRRAGIGKKFGRPSGAGFEDLPKGAERPEVAGGFGREHVVEDEVGRARSVRHRLENIAGHEQPAQSGMPP